MKTGKVLIVCPFTAPNQGGVESHIQKLASYIKKRGRTSIIVSYKPLTTPVNAPFHEKTKDYEIYRLPWFGNGLFPRIEHNPVLTFLYLVPGLLILSLIVAVKRQKEIEVMHAHGFAAGLAVLILKKLVKRRTVISTHAIYNFDNRYLLAQIIKRILSSYDYILAVSEPSRTELIHLGLPKEKIAVHPNWVNTDFFVPSRKSTKPLQALFVGRGLAKKGIFLFGEIAQKNPQIRFVAVVADGPDQQDFKNRFSSLQNLSIITKLPIDFDEKMKTLRSYYQSADVFLMPSLYPEGFAAVILEAASSGLAMISSNLGSLPSILSKSGAILIKPTEENFSTTLKDLNNHLPFLNKLKKQMRNFAQKNFSDNNAAVIYNSYFDYD